MMKNKLIKLAGSTIAAVAMASIVLTAMPQAALAGPAVEKATGSIVMGTGAQYNEKQAINFNAFERETNKGSVTYTNFEAADVGSGVWVQNDATIALPVTLGEWQGPDHVLAIENWTPVNPTSIAFSGTGTFPAWTTTFTGSIVGDAFTVNMKSYGNGYGEAGVPPIETLWAGTIADGSIVDGTWRDDYPAADGNMVRSGTFDAMNEFHEVFSFTAPVTCADVDSANHVATFGYTVPADAGHLPSQAVAVKVFDGGTPGTYDRYEHKEAVDLQHSCDPQGDAYYPEYPIQAGNLVVHAR